MSLPLWRSWWTRLPGLRGSADKKAPKKSRSRRPRLEALEERVLPATTYLVTSTADTAPANNPTKGTLRYAITQIDANPRVAAIITFNVPAASTITLTQGELEISAQTVTITGPSGGLTISGNNKSRIFNIEFFGAVVSMSNLTLTNGNASPFASTVPGNQGGDIFNSGKLTLTNDVIENGLSEGTVGGPAGRGGGIFNALNASLTINSSTITKNLAEGGTGQPGLLPGADGAPGGLAAGGGVYSDVGSTLIIQSGTTITSNQALGGAGGNGANGTNGGNNQSGESGGDGGPGGSARGGGIFTAAKTTLTITGTTSTAILISTNVANGGKGGNGANGGNAGNETVAGFSGPTGGKGGNGGSGGTGQGGGLYAGGSVSIIRTTITNNSTLGGIGGTGGNGGNGGNAGSKATGGSAAGAGDGGDGGAAQGGGLYANGSATLSLVTITNNTVTGAVGGAGGSIAGNGGAGNAFGSGGGGGSGGNGGRGGNAQGGGVFNAAGTFTLTSSTVTGDSAISGAGAAGGNGGVGGAGGATGFGGTGGGAGIGGAGGSASGGGLYTQGASLTIVTSTFTGDQAIATGGTGGQGGNGGNGGTLFGKGGNASLTAATSSGGGVGPGGGAGGDAFGGGIFAIGSNLTISATTLSTNLVNAGAGGNSGQGGAGGNSIGTPGSGGAGGNGGSAGGGGLYATSTGAIAYTASITNATASQNLVTAGAGGQGGPPGALFDAPFGPGGTGGAASGGGIALAGVQTPPSSATLTKDTINSNILTAGAGGTGAILFGIVDGDGGTGGMVSGGGLSAVNANVSLSGTLVNTNQATSGNGGQGLNGGNPGLAVGGGVAMSGSSFSQTVTWILNSSQVNSNTLIEGTGGTPTTNEGGNGGNPGRDLGSLPFGVWGAGVYFDNGNATVSGTTITKNLGTASTGVDGAFGFADGGNAGDGGTALGAVFFDNTLGVSLAFSFTNSTASNNILTAGNGGIGGNAGPAFSRPVSQQVGILGGNGGNGGVAQGGGLFVFSDASSVNTVTVATDSLLNNTITAGTGGAGGDGSSAPAVNPTTGLFSVPNPFLVGSAAAGGNGGLAAGGGFYTTSLNGAPGNVLLIATTIAGNSVMGGTGGHGGTGTGNDGGPGGNGGNGGNAEGGGLFEGDGISMTIINTTIGGKGSPNALKAGSGSFGGNASANQPITDIDGTANGGNGGNGGNSAGGGVFISTGAAVFLDDTIAANTASGTTNGGFPGTFAGSGNSGGSGAFGTDGQGSQGGIYNMGGIVSLGNTIVATNFSTALSDVAGAFTSLGHNIIGLVGTATGFTNGVNGDKTGVTAAKLNLDPLANNGGPTLTDALGAGSIALATVSGTTVINGGNVAIVPTAIITAFQGGNFDQRGKGFSRFRTQVSKSTVDVGAFESASSSGSGGGGGSGGGSGSGSGSGGGGSGITSGDVSVSYGLYGEVLEANTPNGHVTQWDGSGAHLALTGIVDVAVAFPTFTGTPLKPPPSGVAVGPGNPEVLDVVNSSGTLIRFYNGVTKTVATSIQNVSSAYTPSGALVEEVTSKSGVLTQYLNGISQSVGLTNIQSTAVAFNPMGGAQVLEAVDNTGTLTEYTTQGGLTTTQTIAANVKNVAVAFDPVGPPSRVLEVVGTDGSLTQISPAGVTTVAAGVQSAAVTYTPAGQQILDVLFQNGLLVQYDATGPHVLGTL